MQTMQEQLFELLKEKDKPVTQFTLESIYPFPFDKGLHMPPFPKGVELPKYEKYLSTSDPQDHLREFGALSMEFMHDTTYLMHLFPRSLGGSTMEWFSRLPTGIKTFDEIANLFLQHYSHNIQHPVHIRDLCNLKQNHGESLLTFLQRWRQLYT